MEADAAGVFSLFSCTGRRVLHLASQFCCTSVRSPCIRPAYWAKALTPVRAPVRECDLKPTAARFDRCGEFAIGQTHWWVLRRRLEESALLLESHVDVFLGASKRIESMVGSAGLRRQVV